VEGSHTLKDTENSLYHWVIITDIIDAQTAATVAAAALCTLYTTKGILNRLPSLLNILFKMYLILYTVFIHQFFHLFEQVL